MTDDEPQLALLKTRYPGISDSLLSSVARSVLAGKRSVEPFAILGENGTVEAFNAIREGWQPAVSARLIKVGEPATPVGLWRGNSNRRIQVSLPTYWIADAALALMRESHGCDE